MSLDYLISPEARDDIDGAHEWYEAQTLGRGDAFIVELTEVITQLRATPEMYAILRGVTRAAQLPNSKYLVYYRIEPGRIKVTAVQHAAAEPKKWQRRK
jgi:plasmid stabilization system protein ParE